MQYVDFKLGGKQVSRFGLGCMRLPSFTDAEGNKQIDEPAAIELIRAAIDHGVNYIDTAYFYPGSEQVVGKALKDGYREKVILATKLPMSSVKQVEDLQHFYQIQLEQLQVEHIDVYFLHNLSQKNWDKTLEFKAIEFMQSLKEQGKISYIAASIHGDNALFEQVVGGFDWDLIMMQYNYYDKYNQGGEKGLHFAAAKGIPVVVMEPLHGGMLANNVPQVVEDAFAGWQEQLSNAEKSFIWLYNQPEVTVILSGSSSMEQLMDSLRIFEHAQSNILKPDELAIYDKARLAWESIINIECTGCNYCLPCPAKVEIPGIFKAWNDSARAPEQKWLYSVIYTEKGQDATNCINCGKCVELCPQKLAIPEQLSLAHQHLTGN